MNSKKVFLLISEKRERITMLRKSKRVVLNDFCTTCGKRVGWLTFDEVLTITGKTPEQVRDEFKNGKFDFQTTTNEQILICSNSIFRQI